MKVNLIDYLNKLSNLGYEIDARYISGHIYFTVGRKGLNEEPYKIKTTTDKALDDLDEVIKKLDARYVRMLKTNNDITLLQTIQQMTDAGFEIMVTREQPTMDYKLIVHRGNDHYGYIINSDDLLTLPNYEKGPYISNILKTIKEQFNKDLEG